jgi:glucose-6-phosphate 1-dehydrogenase
MINEKSISTLEDFDLVVFGSTGDLSYRKIFPALYHRLKEGQVKPKSRIAAIVRDGRAIADFKNKLKKSLTSTIENIDSKILEDLLSKVKAVEANVENGKYTSLSNWFSKSSNKVNVYYLATPSSVFGFIASTLDKSNLINDQSRIVLEKPLGKDAASSNSINNEILRYFKEEQIYRIDHYLGKETVQNIMVLRFANNLFEHSWNSNHIKNIQITAAEKIGVEKRGDYYDNYGALLDMVQNHLLQLLCLIAMEPPTILNAEEVRNEKLKVLRSLRKYSKENIDKRTVKGQYSRGKVNGKQLPSYLEDIGKYDSETETFVALKSYVDNWRWKGVPFYIRTGKCLTEKFSEIVITFKDVPHNIFPSHKPLTPNKLIIRLQPKEKIEFIQMIKIPGPGGYRYKPISMKMDYQESFVGRFPEAYERLLMDVVRGNQTLFMSNNELIASWDWIASITKNWKSAEQKNVLYNAGSDGPGNDILNKGDNWHNTEN